MKHIFLVPTRNEEKAIRFVLGRIRDNFPRSSIIVVDGHSTDNTVKIAKEFKGVEIIGQKSHGKGGGILEALATLPANTCVTMLDGDGSYDPLDVKSLLKKARSGVFVNGFRKNIDPGAMPLVNLVGNKIINAYASTLLLRPINDMLSGMKCFFVGDMRALGLQSRDFMTETEMTLKSIRAGYGYQEVPIGYHNRIGESKLDSLKDGPKVVKYLTNEFLASSIYGATRIHQDDLMPIDRRTTPYYLPTSSAIFWRRLDTALKLANFKGDETVLDVGSGSGIFLPSLAIRSRAVVACDSDINPARIGKLLEKYASSRNVSIKKRMASQIKGKFDRVFCMDVLEHIRDLDSMSLTLNRRLNPNGRLIVSLPTENKWHVLARKFSTGSKLDDHFRGARQVVSKLEEKFTLEKKSIISELFWVCSFVKK